MKIKNVISENASFQGYFTEVNFYISEGNQLSYFQNGYFFKILWWFHEAHNWVKCRWKNKSIFPTFHWWKIDNTFVTFISNKSLCSNLQNLIYKVYIRLWLYTLNFWSIQYTGLIDFDNYLTTYPKQDVVWLRISHMKYSVVITSWFDIHWRMSKLGITAISHAINQRGTN